jgi:hypothetical protein
MRNADISAATSAPNRASKEGGITRLASHTARKSPRHVCKPVNDLDKLIAGVSGSKKGPRIAFVYQDEEARGWAKEISEKITKVAGQQGVQASWWKISDLTAPGILAGAVSSALRADLIVVATRAEGLPMPFYVWVNLWWPNRSECPGALVAVVGVPERNASRSERIGDYLRVVAEQARMGFVSIEKTFSAVTKSKTYSQPNGHVTHTWNGHLHD